MYQVVRRRPPELGTVVLESQVVDIAETATFNFGAKAALNAGTVLALRHMSELAVKVAVPNAEIAVGSCTGDGVGTGVGEGTGAGTGVGVGVGTGEGETVPLLEFVPLPPV